MAKRRENNDHARNCCRRTMADPWGQDCSFLTCLLENNSVVRSVYTGWITCEIDETGERWRR